ncbi:MAG: hypothetical protein ACRDRJ_31685 [Streptosporangiaceae bacterium]
MKVDVQTGRAAASIWDLFPASSDINVVRCWDLGMEKLSTNARAASWVLGLAAVGGGVVVILVKNNGGGSAVFLLAGLAFLLMAVTGYRITSLTLPGGSGVTFAPRLSQEQRTAASQAVAKEIRNRARQPVNQAAQAANLQALMQAQPRMLHLAIRAAAPQAWAAHQIQQDTEVVAQVAALAAQCVTRDAEGLLRLARTSPDALPEVAQAWGIPQAEWPRLMTGEISQGVWDILAHRAVG